MCAKMWGREGSPRRALGGLGFGGLPPPFPLPPRICKTCLTLGGDKGCSNPVVLGSS